MKLERARHISKMQSKEKNSTDDSLARHRSDSLYQLSVLEVKLRREQKEALEAQSRQHEVRVQVLEQHRDHYKARFEYVHSNMMSLEVKAKELEDRNKAMQKKNDSCVDAIEKLIREVHAYEKKAADKSKVESNEQAIPSTEAEKLRSTNKSLAAENADLLRRLEQASGEFSQVEKKYESAAKALQKSDRINQSLLVQNEELQGRVGFIEAELCTATKALAKVEEANNNAVQQYQTLRNDHTIEMTCIGKVIDGKAAEIASLKAEYQVAKDIAAKYSTLYEETLSNLEIANSQSQNAEQRIEGLNGEVQKLNSTAAKLNKESMILQTTIATKVADNSQLAAAFADKSVEVEQHIKTINELHQKHQYELINCANLWKARVDQNRTEFNNVLSIEQKTIKSLGDQLQAINMQLTQVATAYAERTTTCTKFKEEIEALSSSLAEEVQKTLRLEDLLQTKEAEIHELRLDMLAQDEENAMDCQRTVFEMAQQHMESQKWFGVEALDDDSVTFVDEDSEPEETFKIDNQKKLKEFDEETDVYSENDESMEGKQEMSAKLDYVADFEDVLSTV